MERWVGSQSDRPETRIDYEAMGRLVVAQIINSAIVENLPLYLKNYTFIKP